MLLYCDLWLRMWIRNPAVAKNLTRRVGWWQAQKSPRAAGFCRMACMEFFIQALFWCPRCWRVVGSVMFIACSGLAFMSYRLLRMAERVERKSGVVVNIDQIIAAIPLPIPTTSGTFVLALFGAALGLGIACASHWAQKNF